MIGQPASAKPPSGLLRALFCALALLILAGSPVAVAATPTPHLNSAGLVIQHGDGSVLYFYVQFEESQITGEQLLERSGVQLDITPYAGLGSGVCMIDNEGCPSSNCFCKSYTVPTFFWRYHSLNADGKWVYRATGPAQRVVHDGDVDGWSWSSDEGDLPATSIDAIAKLNGITRTQPPSAPVATPTSPPATPSAVATPVVTVEATRAAAGATARVAGVAVSSNGQTTPIDPVATSRRDTQRNYLWFGAGVIVLALIGGVVALRRRSGATR